MSDNAYATAVKLMESGFSVIPSGGGEKHKSPLYRWKEYQERRAEKRELDNWQYRDKPRLWGIVCGTISGNVLLETDTKAAREVLQAEIGQPPHIISPREGGHWHFKHPGYPVETLAGILPGVDVRGDGGFANVVGTRLAYTENGIHYPDAEYQILTLPAPDNLIPWERLPARIKAAMNGNKPVTQAKTTGSLIPFGQRNGYLFRLASSLRAKGLSEATIYTSVASAYTNDCDHDPPLSEAELRKIAEQGAKYPPGTDHKPGYILTDVRGKLSLDLEGLVNDLLAQYHFATLRDTDEILIYKDGYYQAQGKRFIKAESQRRVGVSSLLTEHKVSEITGHIIRSTYVDRSEFNTDKFTLNLLNGLLDTRSRELRPHTPDHLSTIRIPVAYDATANCPAIRKFLSEVHHSQDIPVVEEVIGYCLTPDNSIQKAVLFIGGGDQGKSTELSLYKALLGADNCSNVPWHALEVNRFAKSALEGKLANIFADLPSHSLNMTSAFKMLTGGDTIGTEKKFGDYFSFVNYAKLIFSANKPPKVLDEDSYAFWRRWLILDFPNQITEDKKDVHILDKLATPSELSGLLNVALDGLDRLRAKGRFSYDKSVEATTEYYLRASDPVYAFLQDCTEQSPTDYITKDDLYDAFVDYCTEQQLPVTKPNSFARSLLNQVAYKIKTTRPEVDGLRVTAWQGIKFSVRDVKDFSLLKVEMRNTQVDKKYRKNTGNPDTIATIRHEAKTLTDTTEPPELPPQPCAVCGSTKFWARVDGARICNRCHPKPGG